MKKLQLLLLEHVNHSHSLEDTKDSGSAPVNIFKKQGKFNIKLQLLLLEHVNHSHSLEDTKDSGSAPMNIFKKQGKFNIKNVTSVFEILLRNSLIKGE
jgi:hypothetical protein